jgi:hypothetical protein
MITFFCLLAYIVGQQVYRHSANDPQIQMAEDIAARLSKGEKASSQVPQEKVDMEASLAPFVLIYDEHGSVIAGSGYLEDALPTPPAGVLKYADDGTENRISWQPTRSARNAAIIEHFNGRNGSGYVLVGRSLRETEIRIQQLGSLVSIVWAAAMIGSLAIALLMRLASRQKVGIAVS